MQRQLPLSGTGIANWSACCENMGDYVAGSGVYYRGTGMLRVPMRSNAIKRRTIEACKWQSFFMPLDERKEDYTL